MPTQKDLKRLVRQRMQKTGESYTSARANLLKTPKPSRSKARTARTPSSAAAKFSALPGVVDPSRYAKIAGMSDAAVERATGCAWKKWVEALDHAGAHAWPHRDIARYLGEKLRVRPWWRQMVAVGYERIRGGRQAGERPGGRYETSKSRTFPVPVATLYRAFAEARARARWLAGVKLTVRKATPHRSVRITWEDQTSVEVNLLPRGPSRSSAQVQHSKLPDRESIARVKQYWDERLDALGAMLGSQGWCFDGGGTGVRGRRPSAPAGVPAARLPGDASAH